jgi:hypothetical protein
MTTPQFLSVFRINTSRSRASGVAVKTCSYFSRLEKQGGHLACPWERLAPVTFPPCPDRLEAFAVAPVITSLRRGESLWRNKLSYVISGWRLVDG